MAQRELPSRCALGADRRPSAHPRTAHCGGRRPRLFDIVPSTDDITMSDNPTKAFQAKPKSSISIGFHLMKEGKIDAFASTGNTGAMLVGSIFIVKPIPAASSAPASPPWCPRRAVAWVCCWTWAPTPIASRCAGPVRPARLMLAEARLPRDDAPKVGLLNIGEEEKKGDLLRQATFELMKDQAQYTFVGNVEGRDLFNDKADVMVCDGFTGNVVLKVIEGFPRPTWRCTVWTTPSCTASTTRTTGAARAGRERQCDHRPRHQQRHRHQEHGARRPRGGAEQAERSDPGGAHLSCFPPNGNGARRIIPLSLGEGLGVRRITPINTLVPP
jgi:hypothetical protein